MKFSVVLVVAVFIGLSCGSASAAALSGTFQMSGIVTVTGNTITWESDAPGNAPDMFTLSGGTGSFSSEAGQNEILNLANPPDVVGGSGFPDADFIHFLVAPLPADLNINFIFPGIYSGCPTGAPAVGQQCTLPGSPFNFVNVQGGATGVESTATWVFSGETSDKMSTWTANFTAQFLQPYQTVLAGFLSGATGASATNSYSAVSQVTVTPVGSVPEPGTMALLGTGLVLLSTGIRRRLAR